MKFKDIKKEKIDYICKGCLKIDKDNTCTIYEKPSAWERKGGCPMKTNVELQIDNKKKTNPIKSSKRGDN